MRIRLQPNLPCRTHRRRQIDIDADPRPANEVEKTSPAPDRPAAPPRKTSPSFPAGSSSIARKCRSPLKSPTISLSRRKGLTCSLRIVETVLNDARAHSQGRMHLRCHLAGRMLVSKPCAHKETRKQNKKHPRG